MKILNIMAVSATLVSCTATSTSDQKNIKQLNVVQKDVEDTFTPLEMKGVNFEVFELSDREALREIVDIQSERHKRYGLETTMRLQHNALTALEGAEGTKVYYRIMATKLNPDTTFHKLYYLDNRDSIIFMNLLKN